MNSNVSVIVFCSIVDRADLQANSVTNQKTEYDHVGFVFDLISLRKKCIVTGTPISRTRQ